MKLKRTMLLLFLLLASVVVGGLVASACSHIEALSWLAFTRSIGISPDAPFELDLSVCRFSFGFSINISVAQIGVMALGIMLYSYLKKFIK